MKLEALDSRLLLAGDALYTGDFGTDSVRRFDPDTGARLGSFVTGGSGGLHGPRGLVFDRGNLLVVNQNVDLPMNGEVMRFDGKTGEVGSPLVPFLSDKAPFSPAGIVVRDNIAYVADTRDNDSTGRIAKYNATTGAYLGDLFPADFSGEFRPRGLVFGPNGELYVSAFSETLFNSSDPVGYILRFDTTTGNSVVLARNNGDGVHQADETALLHNPEGLVFSPDQKIYVTCNWGDENTHILVIDPTSGNQLDDIELAPQASPSSPTRIFAQAALFGPGGKLIIPITQEWLNDGYKSGGIWTYDTATKQTSILVAPSRNNPSLGFPYYLTFEQTNPATLAYQPWHNFADPLDVNRSGEVVPLDVLLIVNEINGPTYSDSQGKLADSRGTATEYFDVNGDGYVVPLDALIIVNYLNGAPGASAEGEGPTRGVSSTSSIPTLSDPVPSIAALFATSEKGRRRLALNKII